MFAWLPDLPANPTMRQSVADVYGENAVFIKDDRGLPQIAVRKRSDWKKRLAPIDMSGEMTLVGRSNEDIATELLSHIDQDLDEFHEEGAAELRAKGAAIFDRLGVHSELKAGLINFLGSSRNYRQKFLQEDILPHIVECFNPSRVVSLAVNIRMQQRIFALLKGSACVKEHGLRNLEEYFQTKEVFTGLEMTGGLPILSVVEAFTSSMPVFMTLPLNTIGTSWHFYGEGAYMLTSDQASPFISIFQQELYPLSERSTAIGSSLLFRDMNSDFVWQLLKFSVDSLNTMFCYANDVFNFLNDQNELDAVHQLQFWGALHLLYADMAAVNYSTSSHIRYHLAFGALEKFGNLIMERNRRPKSKDNKPLKESHFVRVLLSMGGKEVIVKTIEELIAESRPILFKQIKASCENCYKNFHEKLKDIFENDSESERLREFSAYRNFYAHGTFLNRNEFKDIFSNSSGRIPSEIISIPYFVMLAMSCNPERFFQCFGNMGKEIVIRPKQ